MAQCTVCKQFLPPGFVKRTEDNKEFKCLYCIKDTLDLDYVDENGQKQKANKFEIVKEYFEYLNELKENKNIKNLIVEDAVKKMAKGN